MEKKISRREAKKIYIRMTILDSATKEFNRKGFKETSVADIMNDANLGVGTFYNYFKTKDDILLELLKPLVHGAEKLIHDGIQNKDSSIEIIENACGFIAKYLNDHQFILPLFLSSKKESPGFHFSFEEILRQGQNRNEIRSDIPAEIIAEMFHSIYQAASFSKLPFTFEENVRMKIKILLDGIRI